MIRTKNPRRVLDEWHRWVVCLAAAILMAHCPQVKAEVRLPGFIGNSMVLQQQKPIRLWGWADAGDSVTVSLGEASVTATTDAQGRWDVSLPEMKAGNQAHTLTVKGPANTITVNDILIGEVWLCSGQSNMEWTVSRSANSKQEIAEANYPLIRHLKVKRTPSNVPLDDIQSTWEICSPETAGNFTACGYFMARHLHKELNVPIGLINSSWGGTRVEPWTPPVGFEEVDALADIYQSVLHRTPGSETRRKRIAKHIEDIDAWLANAKQAVADKQPVQPNPSFPETIAPFKSHQDPTMLYNGMINALVGFSIRGAIWYQGESNHVEGMLYTEKKRALINGWRKLWGQGDFPFYYVQIAPYQYGNENPGILAQFWEAQAAVQELPNTGMVVTNDIATVKDIHPPNKQDVGLRLALLALKHDYGRDVVAHSPEMDSVEVLEGKLSVRFRNTGGGLKTSNGSAPTFFEVIGPGSRGFHPATAAIDGDKVILTSPKVSQPVAFRFAWHKLSEPNLTGGTGLPVGACRGGEEPDFGSLLSIEKDYRLVYDLDLKTLGAKINYATDNSENAGDFSRIGYLLELRSNERGDQAVFVSVDAFTKDAKKIGVPTEESGSDFRSRLKSMDVFSTVDGVVTGQNIETGNIEFWPNNYGQQNEKKVPGANNSRYDFGDQPAPPKAGYGSMQIHNFGARQTIFAINHWRVGGTADIGIGNHSGENPDWTFSGNASQYSKKRLRVYVK